MLTIFMWGGFYGHAALEINGDSAKQHPSTTSYSSGNQYRYISWYPTSTKYDPLKLREVIGVGVEHKLIKGFQDDVKELGKHPTRKTFLYHLNDSAIVEFWDNILTCNLKYHALNLNCSDVLCNLLMRGWIGTFREYNGSFQPGLYELALNRLDALKKNRNFISSIQKTGSVIPDFWLSMGSCILYFLRFSRLSKEMPILMVDRYKKYRTNCVSSPLDIAFLVNALVYMGDLYA